MRFKIEMKNVFFYPLLPVFLSGIYMEDLRRRRLLLNALLVGRWGHVNSVFHSHSDISMFKKEWACLTPATECCQTVGACSVCREVLGLFSAVCISLLPVQGARVWQFRTVGGLDGPMLLPGTSIILLLLSVQTFQENGHQFLWLYGANADHLPMFS